MTPPPPARLALAALFALVVGGCVRVAPAPAAEARLTGTVTYRERIALGPDAVVRVALEDVSLADAPAVVLAERTIRAGGRQVPFAFALGYDAGRIDARRTYAVRARIEDGSGRLLWINDTQVPVLTRGAPRDGVEVRVVQVRPAPEAGPSGGAGTGALSAGAGWRLVSFVAANGAAGPAERAFTATFGADGRINGQADCNRYFGEYAAGAGGRLSLSRIGATRALCPPGSQDARFFAALSAVQSFSVEGDRLRLGLAEGGALVFARSDGDATGAAETGAAETGAAETGGVDPQEVGRTFAYDCDGASFTLRTGPGEAAVWAPDVRAGRRTVLGQTRAASGARYEGDGLVVWTRGDEALLEANGRRYVGCRSNPPRAVREEARRRGVTFRAVGQEPGWLLEITAGERMRLVADYGEREVTTPAPVPRRADGRTTYRAQTEAHALDVEVEDRPCADAMSGAPYPATVTVRLDGAAYRGCGGDLR